MEERAGFIAAATGFCILVILVLSTSGGIVAAEPPLPVFLVYGFQPLPGFKATQLWSEFAEYLSGRSVIEAQTLDVSQDHKFYFLPAASQDHRDVYLCNYATPYEPTVRDIFFYARQLADEIDYLKEERGVRSLDVIGHSVGGLVARTYAEIDDFSDVMGSEDFRDYGIAYGGEIRSLVLLASPNHGTSIASLGGSFSIFSRQLSPQSSFLQELNETRFTNGRLHALNPTIRYISMAGQTCLGCGLRADGDICLQDCVDDGLSWSGSDLVIMMASAYLPEAENCALIGFDHVKNHTHLDVVAAIERILDGASAPDAIYISHLQRFQPESP